MKKFIALLQREFKLFFNNSVLLMLFVGAPILYGVLIGHVYQKGKVTEMPIIVVDEDHGPMSETFINMLNDNESISIAEILPSLFNSKDIALKHEATTIVHIPKGFSSGIQQNRLPEVTIFVDGANTLTSNTAMMAVNVCAMTMKAGVQIQSQMKRGVPEYVATQQYEPFKTTIIKQNIRSGNYLYFMLPGVLITVLQQVLLLGLALSFASEFESNSFRELVQKMPNAFGLIMVKILPYILMSIGIFVWYWALGKYYQMPLQTDFWWFTLCSFVFLLAVCFIGILVSVILPSQLKATEILMVIATPAFIISGFTWPSSLMPVWVQAIANVIPSTHYLRIFRLMFIQHAENYHTYTALYYLIGIALVSFLAAWIVLSVKVRKVRKELV
ncbi:ABC transporter permease [Sphingobacterium wenxiniae]|uniref:ABC-2 type transport system permease protein n=1 Tax=Sphingobacterium wenxiniae TaxID=683125 RepID=A0A1I6NS34_9SPHI|nr:ABC transporter permease [Sphingobacterium wenxiniae]SFS30733.1 ABC-2 type transport system permease protein [Sphingobacterium wenxiniae]